MEQAQEEGPVAKHKKEWVAAAADSEAVPRTNAFAHPVVPQ
jgi:hypothetical protein